MNTGGRRRLIVNADDFGLSAGVNRGIARAFEEGIVTSASLLVRSPAAAEAARYARAHPSLSVGLHVDLGEWRFDGGRWKALYEVVALGEEDSVRREVARQVEAFRALTSSRPSHVDSHQHVHLREPVRSIVREAAEALDVPVRHLCPDIRYCGSFYGQSGKGVPLPEAITAEALARVVRGLPAGTTELACHPGHAEDVDTPYRSERAREVEALCSPLVRSALCEAGVELCRFEPGAGRP